MSFYNKALNSISICGVAAIAWGGWNDYVTYRDEVHHIPQKYSEIQKPSTPLDASQCADYCKNLSESLSNLKLPEHVNKDTLQSALFELLNTDKVQELVANMRSGVKFDIDISKTDCDGYYNDNTRTVCLTQTLNHSQDLSEKEKQGKYADTIFHELYHAYQYQQGIVHPFGLSPQQFMTQEKLFEAEAMAQGLLEAVIQKHELRGEKSNMETFMIECELQEDDFKVKKTHSTDNSSSRISTLMSPEISESAQKLLDIKRDITPEMALYDQLKTGASLDVATQKATGVMMKHYVGHDIPSDLTYWQQYYDKHGLGSLQCRAKMGHISKDGNDTAYNEVLKYYETKYGLKKDEIDHTGAIHEDNQSLFQKAVQNLDKDNHLISMQGLIQKDEEKAKKQFWEQTKMRIAQIVGIIAILALSSKGTNQQKQEQNKPISPNQSNEQRPVTKLQAPPVLLEQSKLSRTLSQLSMTSSSSNTTPIMHQPQPPQRQITDYTRGSTQGTMMRPTAPARFVQEPQKLEKTPCISSQNWVYNVSTSR